MNDDVIERAAHVIRTTEIGWEIGPLDDRTLAVALAEAGLLADGTALAQAERSRESQRNVADLAHALVTGSDADLKAAQARIEAALTELDRCAIEGYWSGTLVARIRATLTGEEEEK